MKKNEAEKPDSQVEKFRKAARELETDPSEKAFDEIVRKVARTPPKDDAPKKASR